MDNPFGVGYSGENAFDRSRQCDCCGIEYLWYGTQDMLGRRAVCAPCADHSGETLELEVSAYRKHQPRLISAVAKAREMTRSTKRENARLQDDSRAKSQQVAAALKSRDRFRNAIETFESRHFRDGSGCVCGLDDCEILEVLSESRKPDPWA